MSQISYLISKIKSISCIELSVEAKYNYIDSFTHKVTHHAPGQLVAYPILNLNYYIKDLHAYLRLVQM